MVSAEERELGLTHGTRCMARRLAAVAAAGLSGFRWCVFIAAGLRVPVRVPVPVLFLHTHTAYCKYEAALPHIPLHYKSTIYYGGP